MYRADMFLTMMRRRRRTILAVLALLAFLSIFLNPRGNALIDARSRADGTIAKLKDMVLSEDIESENIVVEQFEKLAALFRGPKLDSENETSAHRIDSAKEKNQHEQEERLEGVDAENQESPLGVPEDFEEAVKSRVSPQGWIITPAVIDDGYLDNARNLYVTSIERLNLTAHTLFICISKSACAEARNKYRLPAVMYKEAKQERTGFFNSGAFVQKAMMKHHLIYDVLKMGYDILLTDLDLYWFKDPVEELRISTIKNKRDFVIQSEAGNALNIGFMYVRPTPKSLELYKYVCSVSSRKNIGGAQSMFNNIVKSDSWKKKIKYGILSLAKFPDGYTYFEKQRRTIPLQNPCKECFICHNNWMVGTVAKTYRFREHLMWHLDDNAYYSDNCRKFMVYENPLGRTPDFSKDEKSALKSAIAIALLTNRTLILPRTFHTKKASTQLNGVMLVEYFDKEFYDRYRESTFLHHPLVPQEIKDKECGQFAIMNSYNKAAKQKQKKLFDSKKIITEFVPQDESAGATQDEITKWFFNEEMEKCSVIRFFDLYYAFKGFDDPDENSSFNRKISKALVPGAYRQLELLKKKKG